MRRGALRDIEFVAVRADIVEADIGGLPQEGEANDGGPQVDFACPFVGARLFEVDARTLHIVHDRVDERSDFNTPLHLTQCDRSQFRVVFGALGAFFVARVRW